LLPRCTSPSGLVGVVDVDIVARGVDPQRKMLFVIDVSKALRAAINAVLGAGQPVQRCRAHKPRNREAIQPHHGAPRSLVPIPQILNIRWAGSANPPPEF
jgi:transposase-like protein